MTSKFFPIKTETACQLKWTWSTISLYNGITKSCHRVNSDPVTVDNFDSFHNTPKKLADRQLMLEGKWPSGGCEYCHKIEQAGGSSDRMFHLSIPDMYPPELDSNPTAIEVTPKIVEVYFDNVCNMSCLYCWDGFSSQIQQENSKFGRFEKHGVVIDNYATRVENFSNLTEKFWEWMSKNSHTLKRLHVLGGEPFFQKQFDYCLEFFNEHANPELELNVISNLKVSNRRLRDYIQKIKNLIDNGHLARFDLTASIDCFGPEQEYVRFGIDLNQWRENFEYLVGQSWITLNINQTLSGLTMKTVPDLLKYVNQFRKSREIGHYFSATVMTHKFLHPEIFGPTYFDSTFDKIYDNMPTDTWQQKEALKYMQGIQAQLNAGQRDQALINQLGVFLSEIDRRRNLNWQNTFPWLEQEVNHVV